MDRGSSGTSVHPVCSLCCVGTSGQDPRHELRDVPRSRLWPQRSRIRTLSWRSSGPQPGPLDRPGLLTDLITRPPESLNCKGQHSPLLSMDSALNDLPPRTGRLGLKIGRSAANVAVIDADRAAGEVCCCRERSLVLSSTPTELPEKYAAAASAPWCCQRHRGLSAPISNWIVDGPRASPR